MPARVAAGRGQAGDDAAAGSMSHDGPGLAIFAGLAGTFGAGGAS